MLKSTLCLLPFALLTVAQSTSYVPTTSYDVQDYGNCYSNLPRPPVGGEFRINAMKMGVVSLTYSCKSRYNLVGKAVVSCRSGRWPNKLPTCKFNYRRCYAKFPPAPQFGYILKQKYRDKATACYKCEKGYKLVGPSTIVCTAKKGLQLYNKAPPQCHLDVNTEKTCSFSSYDSGCQYLTDSERPNRWQLEVQKCVRKQQQFQFTTKQKPILAIRLRNSSLSVDPLMEKFENFSETPTPTPTPSVYYYYYYGRYGRNADSKTCRKNFRNATAVLVLRPALVVKRATHPSVLVDEILEVGVLGISVAHFIKFTIEAPLHAVAYGLQVSGHCLPDPPGSLYLAYTLPPSPHSAVHRDFCIKLRNRVRCSSRRNFHFFVRIRFLALFRPSIPSDAGVLRITPKGASRSVCAGKQI